MKKNMKRTLSLFLSLVVLVGMLSLPMATHAETVPKTFTLSSATGEMGDVVPITISVVGDSNFIGVGLNILFETDKLEFVPANESPHDYSYAGPVARGLVTVGNDSTPGFGKLIAGVITNTSDPIASEGVLFNLKFRLLENLSAPTELSLEVEELYDTVTGTAVELSDTATVDNGSISAPVADYTITFDSRGGSDVTDIVVPPNSLVEKPEDPTRPGFTFDGWYQNQGGVQWPYTIMENVTFFAEWTRVDVTLTVSDGVGVAGDDVVITVDISENSGVAAAGLSLVFNNTELAFKSAVAGPVAGGFSSINPQPPVGNSTEIKQALALNNGISAAGSLMIVTFEILPGWSGATPLELTVGDFHNDNLEFLRPAITEGEIVVPAPTSTITFNTDGGNAIDAINGDVGSTVPLVDDPIKDGYNFLSWSPVIPVNFPAEDLVVTALWEEDVIATSTITFNTDGGNAIDAINGAVGSTVPLVDDPIKDGYNFLGWSPNIPTTFPAEDLAVTAQWQINIYTITWDANGGDTGVDTNDCEHGSTPTPIDPGTWAGHTFVGWDREIVPATEDTTYTAQWSPNQYTITWDADNGTTPTTTTVAYGVLPEAPTVAKTGHTFNGWAPEITEATGDTTYTAQWRAEDPFTIAYDNNTGVGVMASSNHFFNIPQKLSSNTFTKEGYKFIGWATQPDGAVVYTDEQEVTFPTGSMGDTIYLFAKWEIKPIELYSIIFFANGGKGSTTEIMELGDTITPPIVTREGYNFIGWDPEPPATVEGNGYYNAQWEEKVYVTITFDTVGGNEILPITGEVGEPMTPPADPTKDTFTFIGWSPNLPAFYPDVDSTYTAEWTLNTYEITWDANGGDMGIDTNFCEHGSMPTPINPGNWAGHTFAGWTPEIVPATEDTTYTAQWTINQYAITFDANGGEGGEMQTLDYGVTPVAPVVTRAGYTFDSWSPVIVAATEDATYTAQWTTNQYAITFDANGGTGDEVQTLDYGVTPVAPIVTRTGYTFDSWTPTIDVVSGDTTYTAQWTINQYDITFDADGGEGGEVQTLDYNTMPIPPVVTKEWHTFEGWDPEIAAVTGNATYTAQWEPIPTSIISFVTGEGGTVIEDMRGEIGAPVTPPADPTRVGYTFNGWEPAIPSTFPDENTEVVAQWVIKDFRIFFDAAGGFFSETYRLQEGLTPVAPIVTREGYTFVKWAPEIVPVTKDAVYTAIWEQDIIVPETSTITFDTDGGSLIDPITGEVGSAVTAPANPTKDGFTFLRWEPIVPETMPAVDVTCVAKWQPVEETTTEESTTEETTTEAETTTGTETTTEGETTTGVEATTAAEAGTESDKSPHTGSTLAGLAAFATLSLAAAAAFVTTKRKED